MADKLLQRPLVFVAHQDDEAIGCGVLLQRAESPFVIFATDGAPEDPHFWSKYGSREALAEVRRKEAERAMAEVGVREHRILGFTDQQLHRNLGDALEMLRRIAREHRSTATVTHAYEGGHPDHDACSYLAARAGEQLGLEVWEMPLYHRNGGSGHVQQFIDGEAEFVIDPSDAEQESKRRMSAAYVSQGDVIRNFPERREIFRRQRKYDYARRPHEGKLNYEAWGWPITGEDLSRAFQRFSTVES
jgi:LmbE family N-acetylglucosaminyl deacetylase